MNGRKIIKLEIIVLAVVVIVGYSIFIFGGFILGPQIIISSPKNGFSTTTPVIAIDGKIIHSNKLALNDDPLQFDLKGNFHSKLILAEGYNIIKITAQDRYDRTVEKKIEITLLK